MEKYKYEHLVRKIPDEEILQFAYAETACQELNATWKHSEDSFPDGEWYCKLLGGRSFGVFFLSDTEEIPEDVMWMMRAIFELAYSQVNLQSGLADTVHSLVDRVQLLENQVNSLDKRVVLLEKD